MEEKIGFIKWLTALPDKQRNTAYSIITITILSSVIYGFGKYIESSTERTRRECMDNNTRLSNKCDYLQKKIEESKEYHLRYVEEHGKRYEELWIKTQQLEKKRK